MKKKPEAEKDNAERWTLTYLDMITLLFVFFVVLYAMSKVDAGKYKAVAESLNAAFPSAEVSAGGAGTGSGKVVTDKTQAKPAVPMQSRRARSPAYDKAYDIIKSNRTEDKLQVRQEERGVVVQLGAEVFFEPGKADLTSDSAQALLSVVLIANSLPNAIQIEGYTDSTPVDPKSGFASNWELSAQRAINILRYLESMGVNTSRMSAVAYGDSHPFTSNDTPEGRSYNRRIDVVFLYDPQSDSVSSIETKAEN
jgi:chemotaxis protein MotB